MEDKHPLTEWREAKGVSQEDLAAQLSVTRWTITSIERGRRKPSFPLTAQIASLTGIPREELRPDVFGEAA